MCTVTYLPLEKGYILTSNRDEWIARPSAISPLEYVLWGQRITFPKDPKANGTWIANSNRYTLCLLNGAFEKHITNPPYRRSRGLVLLDFYEYLSVDNFIEKYNFNGIENFTLLIKSNTDNSFNELRWDGIKIHRKELDSQEEHIWSSSTLYSEEIILERKIWFMEWIDQHKNYNQNEIIKFHRFAGNGDKQNDVIMKRENGVQTLSITSIIKIDNTLNTTYLEL